MFNIFLAGSRNPVDEISKEIGMNIIEKYVVNLPIWTNKGRCMKELKLNNI